ncbi:MAG: hypothetical protein QM682_13825 [Paracoccus sp. (in: a-proteobacteria)]
MLKTGSSNWIISTLPAGHAASRVIFSPALPQGRIFGRKPGSSSKNNLLSKPCTALNALHGKRGAMPDAHFRACHDCHFVRAGAGRKYEKADREEKERDGAHRKYPLPVMPFGPICAALALQAE